jgi:hypothetical protein
MQPSPNQKTKTCGGCFPAAQPRDPRRTLQNPTHCSMQYFIPTCRSLPPAPLISVPSAFSCSTPHRPRNVLRRRATLRNLARHFQAAFQRGRRLAPAAHWSRDRAQRGATFSLFAGPIASPKRNAFKHLRRWAPRMPLRNPAHIEAPVSYLLSPPPIKHHDQLPDSSRRNETERSGTFSQFTCMPRGDDPIHWRREQR